jgi:hypothetical protein
MDEIEKYIKSLNDLIFNDSDTNIGKAYSRHYKEIEKSLPKDIQTLFHSYNFNQEHSLNELRVVANEVSLSFLDIKD